MGDTWKNPKIRDKRTAVTKAWVDAPACFRLTALKLGCVTHLNVLFLVMGFIRLVDEVKIILGSTGQRFWRYTIWFPSVQ